MALDLQCQPALNTCDQSWDSGFNIGIFLFLYRYSMYGNETQEKIIWKLIYSPSFSILRCDWVNFSKCAPTNHKLLDFK